MKPYYEHAGITIYHGDCREVLPSCFQCCLSLVLTDPPYGHGERWSGGTWGAAAIYAEDARRWDAQKFPDEDLHIVLAAGTHSIIWGGNYYKLPASRCWLAWDKVQKIPTMADFELAWTSFERPSKSFSECRNPDGNGMPREHAAQKPLSLFRWCLTFMPEAEVILDPFMGSGTTLLAAKDLGRRAIGIEIEEKYCEIAAKRLSQEVLEFKG